MNSETLIPHAVVVDEVRADTPDVKTFRILTREGGKPFDHIPGQCAMISVPGVGEAKLERYGDALLEITFEGVGLKRLMQRAAGQFMTKVEE